jgi:hypothetical protein
VRQLGQNRGWQLKPAARRRRCLLPPFMEETALAFRMKWPEFNEIAKEIEPSLYDVVLVEAA